MTLLKYWFRGNKLAFNETKTECITCGLRDIEGENPNELRILGVYLDLTLTFDRHVDGKPISSRLSYHSQLYFSPYSFHPAEESNASCARIGQYS